MNNTALKVNKLLLQWSLKSINVTFEETQTPITRYGLLGGKTECNWDYKDSHAGNANTNIDGDIGPVINNYGHCIIENNHNPYINDNYENTQPLHI